MRLPQYCQHCGIADDHRDSQAPSRGQKAAVALLLDHHHTLLIFQQVFDDAETDIAQPTDDDVPGIGDAADFQRSA